MQDNAVAFVIVCWNSRDLLDACLNSIYQQTAGRALVVVVDNGSEDGSQDHIRANHPAVQLIEAGGRVQPRDQGCLRRSGMQVRGAPQR
jgi:GT2 family glycosyltransferase